MKNLILAIFVCLFVSCIITDSVHSQDVFGRAKRTDTTYLDPNDFNKGEVITVDTAGGQNVFIGQDIASSLNQPDKITFVVLDTAANVSAEYSHRVIYSSIVDTSFIMNVGGDGIYELTFSANIFIGKRVVFKPANSNVIFTGALFDPNINILGYIYFYPDEITSSSLTFVTSDADGNIRQGILQPNTIIEITLYPL